MSIVNSGFYWVIVAFAMTAFIAALILSLLFLLKESKITGSSQQNTAAMLKSTNIKKGEKATKRRLSEAFLVKEKAESFLHNLEMLKAQNDINETIYTELKGKYSMMYREALSTIDLVKAEFQRQLDIKLNEQSNIKFTLENLETRFRVGQIPASQYMNKGKNLRNKLSQLERRIIELEALGNATGTSVISHTGGMKMFGYTSESLTTPSMPKMPITTKDLVDNVEVVNSSQTIEGIKKTSRAIEIKPETPKITNLKILSDCVIQGNYIGIIATVFNDRQENATYQIDLKINGEIKQSSDVSLAPRAFQEITFTIATDAPGYFQVEVDGLGSMFRVLPAV